MKRVLVTVKAYPNPSKKYNETVCVAGIDLESQKWIRLYPIPFRDLEDAKQFKKYNVIEVNVSKTIDDKRPESYKVDISTIKIIDWYGTGNNWKIRKDVILPTLSNSFCEILQKSEKEDKSLGIFKPKKVSFSYLKTKSKDEQKRESCYAQLSFYNPSKQVIEKIPYDFKYSFECASEAECPGHTLQIIDWEIGQAFRSWRKLYKDDLTLLKKIEEMWLLKMFSQKNDSYFFVGNWKRFRNQFMILGVFYPTQG